MLAGVGRWCARRRWLVVGAWAVLLVTGVGLGSSVFGEMGGNEGSTRLESVRGWKVLDGHGTSGAEVLAVLEGKPVDDPALSEAARGAARDIEAIPDVGSVFSWYTTPDERLRSTDGLATRVVVRLEPNLDGDREDAAIEQVVDRLHDVRDTGATVLVGGNELLEEQIDETVESDLARGEVISLTVVAIALFFVFGGVLAALLPLLAAFVAIAGTLLVLLGYSAVGTIDDEVITVVTVLSLGLAIDYALLIVNRFREERVAGADTIEAIARANGTAGRAVVFSAVTVAAALSGLFVFGDPTYSAMGAAGVGVALVCVLAAVTLVPALLGVWGARIKLPKKPASDDGFFARITRWSQRRPILVIVGVTVALLAAASPVLHMTLVESGPRLLPASFETRQVADAQARFEGGGESHTVLVAAAIAPTEPAVRAYVQQVQSRPDVASAELMQGLDGTVTGIEVTPADQTADGAGALVRSLRADRPAFASSVTGDAAYLLDFSGNVSSKLPLALLVMGLATLILLFLMTGSVLVPIKAILMNVLSLGASFGAVVWVFQDGHLASLLGAERMGGVESWIPMLVLVFAFGLSMDYEVFLISRVKELYDDGHPNDRAVVLGVQRTGRIITSAALLIVIVFAGFAFGQMVGIKEMGVALTIAIIVDATIVRCFLVPATMSLLGNANWWAPRPLRTLHNRYGLRESVSAGETASGPVRSDPAAG